MRSEQEMLDLLLSTAEHDERIRAVYLNGSRANVKVPKDIFQDFDIVYVVTETASFLADPHWLKRFGEILIMEEPDRLDRALGQPRDFSERYAWLMQFTDGNRIDLSILTKAAMRKEFGRDSLSVVLLDKEALLPEIPAANDGDYLVQRPSQAIFDCRCIDFYWVAPYIAKGLWRNELLYALDYFQSQKVKLITMLNWQVGTETDFTVSTGKSGKYLKNYLSPQTWQKLLATYPGSEETALWQALFTMMDLFEETAQTVAVRLQFSYDQRLARNSKSFVRHIYELPRNAKEIY
ncbi:MAG: aminoglycoside 6-adenylyltransferase [Negativicutes bacterium]|nr:aminoglycoside 6-adenylyltransferase [Negativicutes bacterium]